MVLPVLLLSLCPGNLVCPHVRAQLLPGIELNPRGVEAKLAPDLLERVRGARSGQDRVRVIVQLNERATSALDSLLQNAGARALKRFENFNSRALELPARAVEAMAAHRDIRFISADRENVPTGHVSKTTGADAIRSINGPLANGLDGTGIGIAILDSGIDQEHKAFLDKSNGVRILLSQDFTGEGRTDDPYGHGTHVASIAAGNGRISNAEYIGVAPNSNIINLRVLNSQGAGTASAVLSRARLGDDESRGLQHSRRQHEPRRSGHGILQK